MPQPLNIHLYLLTNLHFRGKDMLSYEDDEISDVGGYDLVHYDDLSYVASAHQERKTSHIIWKCERISFMYLISNFSSA